MCSSFKGEELIIRTPVPVTACQPGPSQVLLYDLCMQAQKKSAREEMDGATKAREALRSQVPFTFLPNHTVSKDSGRYGRWSNSAVSSI